jgi:hypothetical protein
MGSMSRYIPLIPAQAGIQKAKHSALNYKNWVPAFAGTSGQ